MQALAREITPMMSAHRDNIMLNMDLFKRVKAVYEKRNSMNLNHDQVRLVEKIYKDFERGGANLPEGKQAQLRETEQATFDADTQIWRKYTGRNQQKISNW